MQTSDLSSDPTRADTSPKYKNRSGIYSPEVRNKVSERNVVNSEVKILTQHQPLRIARSPAI